MKSNWIMLLALLGLSMLAPALGQSGALGFSSLVSTTEPGLRVPANAVVSWSESSIRIYPDERLDVPSANRIFRTAIENKMTDKGYQLSGEGVVGEFELGFMLALSSSLDDDEMLRKFGFSPGLGSSSGTNVPEKGTLVVILINPRNGRSMWRGAIEAFADLGATDTEREQRAASAVGRLLRLMPDAK
jgi:hypothetical protein